MSSSAPMAIVTGGGSGIGQATGWQLAQSDWDVLIVGRRASALQDTAARYADRISTLAGDLRDPMVCDAVIDRANAHGRLDAIVHCAGDARFDAMEQLRAQASVDTLRSYMELHVEAALRLVIAGWSLLQVAAPGRVVLVSSLAAHDPLEHLGIYGMAKSALEGLARATHVDSGGAIKAFAVAPGCVDTPMLHGLVDVAALPDAVHVATAQDVASHMYSLLEGAQDECSGSSILLQG